MMGTVLYLVATAQPKTKGMENPVELTVVVLVRCVGTAPPLGISPSPPSERVGYFAIEFPRVLCLYIAGYQANAIFYD